jgi:hypothetical protein
MSAGQGGGYPQVRGVNTRIRGGQMSAPWGVDIRSKGVDVRTCGVNVRSRGADIRARGVNVRSSKIGILRISFVFSAPIRSGESRRKLEDLLHT